MSPRLDAVVIGGGIVGLATARALQQRYPAWRVCVLEKEAVVGVHQTGHNSGVIHSGVYYKPGSLKAKLCVAGSRAMDEYCLSRGLPHLRLGKIIVAVRSEELPILQQVFDRGRANGLAGLELLGPAQIREYEPRVVGLRALHVPSVAVVDYAAVARSLALEIVTAGGAVKTNARVTAIRSQAESLVIESTGGAVESHWLINCAGLFADRICALAECRPPARILPFRGEYHDLVGEARNYVRGLIYPVPDTRFPFLGVHFTPSVHGPAHAGPNAVLALRREGYKRSSFSLPDVVQMAGYRGAWAMAARYWRKGLNEEVRSLSQRAFLGALKRLIPDLTIQDLAVGGTGVRAMMVFPNGRLADDFYLWRQGRMIHALNVPSPAATASLEIGRYLASQLGESSNPQSA